jgi:DNA-binding beta-propeller fold protein YncE
VTALHQASGVALSPDGRLVYVASEAADSVTELLRDPASGRLAPATPHARGVPSVSDPQALAASRDGRDLYLASPFDDAVAGLGV